MGAVAGVWLLLAGAALLDSWLPHPTGVVRAEFGTGFADTILKIGAGLAGLFHGKIDSNVKTALDGMRLTLAVAFEAIAHFGKEAGVTQAKSVGLLRHLWDLVILGFIRHVDQGVKSLHDWLKKTFGPVLRALVKVRKLLLKFYDKWFKPIFDTIDAIRGVLRVLGFLHLDVARKLDEKLAALEHRLRKPIEEALEAINKAINWVDRIVDLNGFFQRYTLVKSIVLYERDFWKNAWASAHKREIEKPPSKPPSIPAITAQQHGRELGTYYADEPSPAQSAIDEHAKDLMLMLTQGVKAVI